jgi:hypothetical protein
MTHPKLLKIIKEEFEEIIISEEPAKDEILDFNEINLYDEYNKLNKLLFNGSLPEVPMKWSNRKRALGHVKFKHFKNTGKISNMELWISKFFSVTYQQFLNTLAHEMIHIYQLSKPNPLSQMDGKHGSDFMKEAQRINNMGLGFNITKTNGEDLALSQETKEKIQGKKLIVLLYNFDGDRVIAVTTPKIYERDNRILFDFIERLVNSGRYNKIEVDVILSNNPILHKSYRQQRSITSIRAQGAKKELLDDLERDNTIRKLVFTRYNVDDSKMGSSGAYQVAETTYIIS